MESIIEEIRVLDQTEGIWEVPCLRFTSVCFFGVISDLIEDTCPALLHYTQELRRTRNVENVAIFVMEPHCMVPPHVDPILFGEACTRELLLLTPTRVRVTQQGVEQELVPFQTYSLDTSVVHSAVNHEETSYLLCLDFLREGVDRSIYDQMAVTENLDENMYLEFNRQNVLKTYHRPEKRDQVLRRFSSKHTIEHGL